jgi:uncharacterized protein (DUF433 family)
LKPFALKRPKRAEEGFLASDATATGGHSIRQGWPCLLAGSSATPVKPVDSYRKNLDSYGIMTNNAQICTIPALCRRKGDSPMNDASLFDVDFSAVGGAITKANADVGAAVAQAQASREEFVRRAEATVEKTMVLGQLLRRSWETLFTRPESGVAERARALRGGFLQNLGQSLELMRFALGMANRAALLEGEPLHGAAALAVDMAALESIQRDALAQWGVSEETAARLAAMPDVPLKLDKQGDIHVGGSRVLLDTVIDHFKAGMSPADIARGYDTIQPAEIYETIAYYLRHKDDVEAYLQRRNAEAGTLWQAIEASQPSKADLKAEIKHRWSRRKADHAAPAE